MDVQLAPTLWSASKCSPPDVVSTDSLPSIDDAYPSRRILIHLPTKSNLDLDQTSPSTGPYCGNRPLLGSCDRLPPPHWGEFSLYSLLVGLPAGLGLSFWKHKVKQHKAENIEKVRPSVKVTDGRNGYNSGVYNLSGLARYWSSEMGEPD